MKELTYEEVLDQIEHQRRFGNRPGAEVSALMLEKLGRPQQNMSVIHIAGTNGKGSVSAFLCSILKEAGIVPECLPHRTWLISGSGSVWTDR